MRNWMIVVLGLAMLGCGDRDGSVDFSGEEVGPDIHAIVSEDGNVKMAVTSQWVYFALSDSARAEAQAELDTDAEAGGVKGFFGGLMRGMVRRALDFRARYAVAEVRDIRWEDGGMRIEFVDPDRRVDQNLEFGEGQSVREAFSEDAVQEISEVFRAVKGEIADS